MWKTLRFLSDTVRSLYLIYIVFAVVIIGGCRISGSQDGLFGVYCRMLPMFAVMFGSMIGFSIDAGGDVPLSMGALRRDCFWAMQIVNLTNALFLSVFVILVEAGVADVPTEDPDWPVLGLRGRLCLFLLILMAGQLSLMINRMPHGIKLRGVLQGVSIIFSAVLGGVAPFFLAEEGFATVYPSGQMVARVLPAAAVVIFIVCGIVCRRLYAKAVVRA